MKTQLIELTNDTAMSIFTGEKGLDPYVQQVVDEVNCFEHDLTTAAGRKRTISLASKVAKIKVKYDDCGKDLVSVWKASAAKVDKARKKMRDELDDLKILARKPVTDWEVEQEKIEAEKQLKLEAEMLAKQKANDEEVAVLMDEKFDRELAEAVAAQLAIEKAEQERLIQAKIDNDIRIAKEATIEAERLAQEEINNAKIAEQKAIDDKVKADKELLESQAREKLLSEQVEEKRINDEWLVYITEAYDINNQLINEELQKQQQALAEQQRIDAIEVERLAGIERQRLAQKKIDDEAAERKANTEHNRKVNQSIVSVLVANGITNEDAVKMVTLAVQNKLPHLTVAY